MPGHFVDPPCGRAYYLQQNFPVQQSPTVDFEIVSMHLKHLASSAKDAVTEGGSVPGSKAKLWRRIREFNACIPYSGVPSNTDVPEVILMALITMLPATPDLPPEAPPPPSPSPKAAATIMGFVACLRRLLSSRSAASHVMSFPAAVGRIMGLLRNGSEGIAAEAAGLIAMLIGSDPGDSSVLTDSKGERHASIMHTKSVLFAHSIYATILVSRLRPMSVSPLLSMSIVEVLEAMLCEPYGETTQHTTFVELLRQVAGLRRRLFALFGHPAKSVGETVSVIMRTIAEEDAIAAESMRDASLRDGALLRCLVEAFSLPFCERRDISRQLVALWADSYQPAMDLLSRVLPPGLVAYLHTRSEEGSYEQNQNQSGIEARLNSSRHEQNLHQRKGQKGSLSHERIPSHVSLEASALTNQRGASTNSIFGTDQNNIRESGSGQVPTSHFSSPGINTIHEHSHVSGLHTDTTSTTVGNSLSYLADSNHLESVNFEASIHPDLSSPAQIFIENNAPVGSGRLLCNWHEFWKAFGLDHNRADLIWNESTRRELRESLSAEVHKLDVEKERSGDIVSDDINTVAGQDTVPQISWNHIEFSVNYQSLSDEVCVGQYYLRLLLESRSFGKAQDFPLRDPVSFFRALYHRFLCDADTGLTVDGVVPDELGSSEDWCDMGRLDGFGGGGGASVRELCARAMSIVYEQHYKTIGPFDGTAHITVLLDRTDDRALRHRLLILLKVFDLQFE